MPYIESMLPDAEKAQIKTNIESHIDSQRQRLNLPKTVEKPTDY